MSLLASFLKPLLYISPPLFLLSRSTPSKLPAALRPVRYYTRVTLYLGCMASVAVTAFFIASFMGITGRKYDTQYVVARLFYGVAGTVLGLELRVEGEEHLEKTTRKPRLLMMNHQSMLDIFFVGRLLPRNSTIMSKTSLKYTPLGPFMLLSGTIFITRTSPAKAIASLNAAGRRITSLGLALWMFPEGTRTLSPENKVRDLKKGGFHLAIQNELEIVPIVAENYFWAYANGVFEEGVLKVRVCAPVSTKGLKEEDAGSLASRVHDVMAKALEDISRPAPRPSTPAPSVIKSAPVAATPPAPAAVPVVPSTTIQIEKDLEESSILVPSQEEILRRERTLSVSETSNDSEDMVIVGRPT